ncbi:MAG: hypothetical protein V3U65_10855 [Granulosicoccaceae bacterium]
MMSQRAFLLMSCLIPLCVSCIPEHNTADSSNLTLQPPASILAARMVDPSQLRVEVTVDDKSVEMSPVGDGNFFGNISLAADNANNVEVSWFEYFEERDLLLAQASKVVTVSAGDTEATITIRSSEFDTNSWDADSDGRSNLSERIEGTGPRDSSDPAAAPTKVAVEIQLNISNSFQAAAVNTDDLTMEAFVNSQSVALTRSGLIWMGGLELNENSDAFINATLFRESGRVLRIGDIGKSVNVGSGGIIVVPDTDFNFEYDDDQDGFFNLDEILNGHDPLNSESPVVDPCVPTTFVAECLNDEDRDGTSDFLETENADEDMDTIPDYLESSVTDFDEDIFPEQTDPDDTDPCIPNDEAIACVNG